MSKLSCTEKEGKVREVPPTEFELKAVPASGQGSEKRKGGRKKRVFDCSAVDAGGKRIPAGTGCRQRCTGENGLEAR